MIISRAKYKQIIQVNRMLAGGIIILALVSVYVYSQYRGWLITPKKPAPVSQFPAAINLNHGIKLPNPTANLNFYLGKSLATNLQKHEFEDTPLNSGQIGAILWAAQGTITPWGDRTAPSYKSLYPLTLTVWVRASTDIPPGVYLFDSRSQSLIPKTATQSAIPSPQTPETTLDKAPVIVGMSVDTKHYLSASPDNTAAALTIEAGQIAENIYLASQAQGLGTIIQPRFAAEWQTLLKIPQNEQLVMLMPVGVPKETQ